MADEDHAPKPGDQRVPDPGDRAQAGVRHGQGHGLTVQPLWQGPGGSTNPTNPTPSTWTTCVLIAPTGTGSVRPATAAETQGLTAGTPARPTCGRRSAPSTRCGCRPSEAKRFRRRHRQGRGRGRLRRAAGHARQHQGDPVPGPGRPSGGASDADTPNNFPGSKQGPARPALERRRGPTTPPARPMAERPRLPATMQVCFNPTWRPIPAFRRASPPTA